MTQTIDARSLIASMSSEERQRLADKASPRLNDEYTAHIPHPAQQAFLGFNDREVMYGGAAGGGKSDALLMAALQYIDVPGYAALILRRTWPDLSMPGAIMDRASQWLTGKDCRMRDGGRKWEFPSGAVLAFGHMQHDKNKYNYQSSEWQFVGFDELTHFEEGMYTYMFSRVRRPDINCLTCKKPVKKYTSGWKHTSVKSKDCPALFPDPKSVAQYGGAKRDGMTLFDVPLRIRSATNPGGIGHQWVRARFIDPRTRTQDALFVPALLRDNPSLDRASYVEMLQHLSPVDRERLLAGDWDVEIEGGYFQRHWFKGVNVAPATNNKLRYWDLAATKDGDYTVGALVSILDGRYCVEDIVRLRGTSFEVERAVLQTAMQDGVNVPIYIEQEPGSSGVNTISHYQRNILTGFNVRPDRPTGAKVLRAGPLSSAAEAGNVSIIIAKWNREFLDEFGLFDQGAHDDQVDAVSGAVNILNARRTSSIIV